MPTHPALPVLACRWQAASRRGPRLVNADATAVFRDPATGATAFAVADRSGDDERAAAARLGAGRAARAAVRFGPARALQVAKRALLAAAPADDGGDCVLVVAVPSGWSTPRSASAAGTTRPRWWSAPAEVAA